MPGIVVGKPEITLDVEYSCNSCGLKDITVKVRVRKADENVIEWMENAVIQLIGFDHYCRSPNCQVKEISQVKIPLPPGSERIGDPTRH